MERPSGAKSYLPAVGATVSDRSSCTWTGIADPRGRPGQPRACGFEMKILLVEDAAMVVESVTLAFQLQWADVEIVSAAEGGKAIELVEIERPDLVLLDVGLPDIDGYRVLQAIREFSDIPVIMLTARDETMDKVKGLELGADDYITKPFDHLELLARIRTVLRRLDMPAPRSRIPSMRSADLEIDFQVQEARLKGQRLDLTPTEYKLLYHLVRNAGRILTHETLLSRVWGRDYSNELDYLRVYIRRLRDKLKDDPARPVYIRTERGIGYRFIAPPPSDAKPEPSQATGDNRLPKVTA